MNGLNRELEYLRLGHLTFYVLKIVRDLPRVEMQPYYALIAQHIESQRGLGCSKSGLYKRLRQLEDDGFLRSEEGASSNPRAKRPVRFYALSTRGEKLLQALENERTRLGAALQ